MLTFCADTHTYYWNGVEKKSVTQVMEECGLIDARFFTEYSRRRGLAVHRGCQLLLNGVLDWKTVDPRIRGYMEGMQRFVEDTMFEPTLVEEALYDPDLDIAGTLDIVGIMQGIKYTLIDIKTGKESEEGVKNEKIQTRFYQELVQRNYPSIKIKQRHSLHLRDNGTYWLSVAFLKHAEDMNDCNSLLRTIKLKAEKK